MSFRPAQESRFMKSRCILVLSWISVAGILSFCTRAAEAQETPTPASTAPSGDARQAVPATSPALRLTLEDTLARARRNSTQFQPPPPTAPIAPQDPHHP